LSNKITFSDLIGRIADETGASKRAIRDLLKELAGVTHEALLRDGRVSIPGLGILKLKWRDARQGINPQTGEPIQVPAQNRVDFKSQASLRRFINRGYQDMKPEILVDDTKSAISIPKSRDSFFRRKRTALGWTAALLVLFLLMLAGFLSLFRPSYEPAPPDPDQAAPQADLPPTSEPIHRYSMPDEEPTEKEKQIQQVSPVQKTIRPEGNRIYSLSDKGLTGEEEQSLAASPPHMPSAPRGKPPVVHNVQQGESLWTIAKRFYTDPYLWPNIFRVNIEIIGNPDTLEVATTIQVPLLEGKVGSLTQKDIVRIIDGYMQVYLVYRRLGKSNARHYLWVAKQYNVPEVLEQYEDRIDKSDRDFILRIKGSARIK